MSLIQRLSAAGLLSLAVLGAGVAVGTGCKHADQPAAPAGASLYDRLGGDPAITAVIDDFVNRAASDQAVNFTRKSHANEWKPTGDDIVKLKKHLTQFVESATGGPQKYEGRPNAEVHKGMGITEAEWNAIVADLKASLDKFKVPSDLQNELIGVVATTHNDVVGL